VNPRILAINPGSTSTKVALFSGEEQMFRANLNHEARELAGFDSVQHQLPYRRKVIRSALESAGVKLGDLDAISAYGGGLEAVEGGTYPVNATMLADASSGRIANHPAVLGCQIARELADELGIPAYVVNPPDVDEFDELARVTGLDGVTRASHVHALNHKEVAHRYAASLGRRYQDLNLVVAHLGGGVSVAAHRRGRMVDCNDVLAGDGPMAPTRCGTLPARAVLELVAAGQDLAPKLVRSGGLVDHLGTSDTREVCARIEAGDQHAKLIYQAMIYQVGKAIGGCVAVLGGQVDGILLTGGIVHDPAVVQQLTGMVSRMGPIGLYAGELEMEGLAAGVRRVLEGQEPAREYTGVPVWSGFSVTRGAPAAGAQP
jgi:butyrate kinase